MFTFKFFRNTLLNGVNLSRILPVANARSLQLFRRPNEVKKDDDDAEDFPPEKIALEEQDEQFEQSQVRRKDIFSMRNKSRLRYQHRNVLFDRVPYYHQQNWIHETLKYKRYMYGRYGESSGVDPRICFETQTELDEKQEYERVAFPNTIQEMIAIEEENKRKKKQRILDREAHIAANIKKLDQWKTDIINRRSKKEEEARVAKERKDRLIEEVRRHFGYSVHPKDERFKEMLEKKEKEQKKALKEAKKQQKESKLLTKIADSQKVKATPAATVDE